MGKLRAYLMLVLHRDTGGQTAFLVLLAVPTILVFFAMSFDAGLWYFDHRTAQNQADASALAAVSALPAADTASATAAADTWLVKNGSDATERSCLEYSDRDGDGLFDTVRVCVSRDSPGVFAKLAGFGLIHIGAAATASVGRAAMANVMPWAIVPPDPTCDSPGEVCQADMNNDGTLEDCGYYPPVPEGGALCPWGLSADKLYAFKVSGTITPGNFGAIAACGQGATEYRNCINGTATSEFFAEGETVQVGTQTGNLGANTNSALAQRYASELVGGAYTCDVAATPDPITGLDPDGKALAVQKFLAESGCGDRLVIVPIIDHFPQGASEDILVMGIATFGIVRWDRNSPWGDALGTTTQECGQAGEPGYQCGMVWGFLMVDANAPGFLIDQVSDSGNPFAPLVMSLTE